MASSYDTVESRAGLWQIWKVFKLIFDIILIILMDKGFMSNAYTSEIVALNIITILFVASSLCELAAYNHENIKKAIFRNLLGRTFRQTKDETQDERNTRRLCRFIWFWIILAFSGIYLQAYILITLARLVDVRECFWRRINYRLNNILAYVALACLHLAALGLAIAGMASPKQGQSGSLAPQILTLVMISVAHRSLCLL